MLRTFLPKYSRQHLQKCISLQSCRPFSSTFRSLFPRATPHKPPPSFQEQVLRADVPTFRTEVKPSIRNQILFAIFGSALVFELAALKTQKDTEYWTKVLKDSSYVWLDKKPTSDEMKRAQYFALGKKLQQYVVEVQEKVEAAKYLPLILKNWIIRGYVMVAQPYLDTTEGRRLCWKISLLNTAIYAAWKMRGLSGFMNAKFVHHPLSGVSITLLTSVFSHATLLHLVFNCMALNSFGAATVQFFDTELKNDSSMRQESTASWHFLAFYVSAGLFSGLVSHVTYVAFRYPRLIAQLSSLSSTNVTAASSSTRVGAALSATAVKTVVEKTTATSPAVAEIFKGSLGASGAIYAAVMVTALGFPDSEVALVIPPSYPIPIQWGVGGLLALDMIGVWRGWRLFDHYAHLGGAAFGVIYYACGPRFWNYMRSQAASI